MKLLENVMVEFHKKEKGIYIISSHDIECLQNVFDKCLLLHNGQIREIRILGIVPNKFINKKQRIPYGIKTAISIPWVV